VICTEQEAKAKWCPQVRFVPILDDVALSPANRLGPEKGGDDYNPAFSRCIGSACMMWVWVGAPIVPDYSKDFGEMKLNPDRSGTCGLIRSQP
jgi:hypothetical protein